MRDPRLPLRRLLPSLLAAGVLASTGFVQAQGVDSTPAGDTSSLYRRHTFIDSSGDYQREVQACRLGLTQQAKEDCLEEARNARADRRRGELARVGEDYTANALARCQPFTGEYRIACEARVMGFGSTSGSVAGGGLIRQVETAVLPAGADLVHIHAQTADPVLLISGPPK